MDIDPDSAEVLILSSSTHTMRHRPEEAIVDCQKAAIIAPNNAEVLALAGFAYAYSGQYEQALMYLDTSLRLSPIYPNWYMIVSGQIVLHSGSIEKAIEDLQRGIDLEPESTLVRYYLINALITAGNLTKAKKVAQEIKALDPSFGIAGFIRSYSHDETKRFQFQLNLEKVGFNI
jgi:adenylate cyclase